MRTKNIVTGLILVVVSFGLASYVFYDVVSGAVNGVITISGRITGLSAPTASSDAATKAYVDAAGGGGKTPKIQTFTSDSTWTRPTGVDVAWVTMVGGGGAGGGSSVNCMSGVEYYWGGGGGGGQSYMRYPVSVTGNVSVVVGAGGSTSTWDGENGGDSSFGSLIAKGGKGGFQSSYPNTWYQQGRGGKSGGRITGESYEYGSFVTSTYSNDAVSNGWGSTGGHGGAGASSSFFGNGRMSNWGGSDGPFGGGRPGWGSCGGGGGGSSILGQGGNGGLSSSGGGGTGYGAGGGGGNGASKSGGKGSPGVVIVEWVE